MDDITVLLRSFQESDIGLCSESIFESEVLTTLPELPHPFQHDTACSHGQSVRTEILLDDISINKFAYIESLRENQGGTG